jgi:UDP-glucose:(heptosyl)LPS alpha-1,3-glucosyltransferase
MVLPHRHRRDFATAALRLKKEKQIDLLFSMERLPGCDIFRAGDGVHAAWLARQARVQPWWRRLIRTVSGRHRELLRLERELFAPESKTFIIANSRMVAQEIEGYFSIPSSRMSVIYNGVPAPACVTLEERASLRRELGMREGECAVLFVGSGWRRKGLETALAAVKKAAAHRDPGTMRLWVAGKGNSHTYASSSIKFLGPIQKLSRLYAAADLFILPTLYDPFSNASLEALASGLPVITSAANGCAEIIDPDIHGTIIKNPQNVDDFADALIKWQRRLEDPKERAEIRHVCAARGAQWSIERNIEATCQLIESYSLLNVVKTGQ